VEEALALTSQAIEAANGGKSLIEHGVVRRETGQFERVPAGGS
jgi:hypothetical protein